MAEEKFDKNAINELKGQMADVVDMSKRYANAANSFATQQQRFLAEASAASKAGKRFQADKLRALAAEKAESASYMEQKRDEARFDANEHNKELNRHAASQAALKAKGKVFNDIANTLKNIPGIGGVLSDVFTAAAKKTEETGSRLKGVLSVFTSIAKVAGPAALLKSMLEVSNQTQTISRNLGIGFEASRGIRKEFSQIARDSNDVRINSTDLLEAQGKLQQSFGLSAKASGEVSINFIRNSEYLGASVEAAGKLEKIIAINGGSSSEFAGNLALAANETSRTYGINLPLAKVVEKISKLQGATLSYLKDSPKALTEAVAISTKLGIEFSKIRGIADGLVNFESSITAELEAEVLLGKDINLNKARQLAFMGDEVGLAKEIGNLIGTSADLNAMLPIQQQSYAKALGMSRDELADMVMQQELSVKFGKQARDFSTEQLKAADALAEKDGIGRKEALRRIQEEVSATAKFEDAAKKIKGAFQDAVVKFAPLIEKVADIVGTLAKKPFAGVLAVGGALLGTGMAIFKGLQGLTPATAMWTRPIGAAGVAGGGGMGMMGGGLYNKSGYYKGGQLQKFSGKIPKGSTFMKGGLTKMGGVGLGAVGALAGSAITANAESGMGKAFGSTLSAAGTGAMIGSVIPGIGTAAGAIIGAGYGAITGFLDMQEAKRVAKSEQIQKDIDQRGAVAEEIRALRKVMEEKDTTINMDSSQVGKALNKGSAMYTNLYTV